MNYSEFKNSQIDFNDSGVHKNFIISKNIMNHIKILSNCISTRTILNYGSGVPKKDSSLLYKRFKVTDYDIGIKGKDELPDTMFDGVLCLNVLEYIPEELLEVELEKIFSKSKKWVIIEIGYLYNDRILSHKGIHEWKRIIHKYNVKKLPLYITSEYNFKVPRTKFPRLPQIDNKRVIIVGNAISSLEDNSGDEIDKYDVVIRIGNGIENSLKFPKQIGTKADICILGDYKYFFLLNKYKFMYNIPIITSKARARIIPESTADFFEQEPYTLFENKELVNLSHRLGCSSYKHMSTGLLTVLYILQKYKVESLSIVGFDNFSLFSNKKRTNSVKEVIPHYSVQREILTKNVNSIHDSKFENGVLSDLESNGEIIWLNKKYISPDKGKNIELEVI